VSYDELPDRDTWILVPRHEHDLINRLRKSCRRLDARELTREIFVGIQTSADHIYHLQRIGKDTYLYQPPKPKNVKTKPPPEQIRIEDEIMHPIVSGQEVQKFEVPQTNTFVLFPYVVYDGRATLLSQKAMVDRYPMAWTYLCRFEKELRARERSNFDDKEWYRFGRHQNINKQDISKILVPRFCTELVAVNDSKGDFYIDNVDVGAIQVAGDTDPWFLTGILNSSTVNFVWKRIAKPFQNNYYSANKQFIAPLPIPSATAKEIKSVSALAQRLTQFHTKRRNDLLDIERRFAVCAVINKPEEWLWPRSVNDLQTLQRQAPSQLDRRAKTAWARKERLRQIATQMEFLTDRLRPNVNLIVSFHKGELRLTVGQTAVLEGIFLAPDEGQQVVLSWNHFLRTHPSPDAPTLARGLRAIRVTDNKALITQIEELDHALTASESEIHNAQRELDQLAFTLYKLSSDHRRIVEHG
jgi:hypothetical protein